MPTEIVSISLIHIQFIDAFKNSTLIYWQCFMIMILYGLMCIREFRTTLSILLNFNVALDCHSILWILCNLSTRLCNSFSLKNKNYFQITEILCAITFRVFINRPRIYLYFGLLFCLHCWKTFNWTYKIVHCLSKRFLIEHEQVTRVSPH